MLARSGIFPLALGVTILTLTMPSGGRARIKVCVMEPPLTM